MLSLWETPVRCTATVVALRVVAHQRGACFKASCERQNKLTKQHTKQTVADDSHAEKKLRNLSSLHIKHDVNYEFSRMTRDLGEIVLLASLVPTYEHTQDP
eukprot:6211793-Pleurochrysis_carterae.AAC.1